jgi:hypothetical protein
MRKPMDSSERLTVLEVEHRHHKETLADVVVQLERLNDQVGTINSKIDKNMGFIAGVAFVFSMMGAILGLFGGAVMKKIGGA